MESYGKFTFETQAHVYPSLGPHCTHSIKLVFFFFCNACTQILVSYMANMYFIMAESKNTEAYIRKRRKSNISMIHHECYIHFKRQRFRIPGPSKVAVREVLRDNSISVRGRAFRE
jgi:hypothetical protein